jgi:WD40 repeat protein
MTDRERQNSTTSEGLPATGRPVQVDSPRHLVITVHGIRTFGQWQDRLLALLKTAREHIEVVNYRYGYFSVVAFMIPFLRWLVTRRFKRDMLREIETADWQRVDIVAHSFGTHLVGWGLYGIPAEKRPKIHTIILAGSVLKAGFPWRDLMKGCVGRVINDCGINDWVLVLNQLLVLFTGMAGRFGFNGMTGERFRNRYFLFGHSGYFVKAGQFDADNGFMEKYWVPLLTTDEPSPSVDNRKQPGALHGLVAWALNNAEPIKLAVYILPILLFAAYVNGLRVEAREQAAIAECNRIEAEQQRNIAQDNLREAVFQKGVAETNAAESKRQEGIADDRRRDAEHQRRRAEEQTRLALSRQYSAQAINRLNEDRFDQSLFYSLRAHKTADTIESRSSLLTALEYNPHLTSVLRDYTKSVGGLAYSPDGKKLAVAGDEIITLLDATTHAVDGAPFVGHHNHISCVAFNPKDGNTLSSCDLDGVVMLWDVSTRRGQTLVERGNRAIKTVAFSPDGALLAWAGAMSQITVWDVAKRKPRRELSGRASTSVESLAFSPDGRTLASGDQDGIVVLWDIASGDRHSLPYHSDGTATYSIAFSPDGKKIAFGLGRSVILGDLASHEGFNDRLEGYVNEVKSVAFALDGEVLVTADAPITLWNVATRERIGPPLTGHRSYVKTAVNQNGKTMASGDGDGTIIFWDLAAVHRLGQPFADLGSGVERIAISPDGTMLASSSCAKRVSNGPCVQEEVRLWDVVNSRLRPVQLGRFAGLVYGMGFGRDSKSLWLGSCSRTGAGSCDEVEFHAWDVVTANPLRQRLINIKGARNLNSLAFSPDGRMMSTDGCIGKQPCERQELLVFDVATGNPLKKSFISSSQYSIVKVAFNPRGSTMASISGKNLTLWDLATGKSLGAPILSEKMVFSPDGRLLASFYENTITLINGVTGERLEHPLTGATDYVTELNFSPDAKLLASAGSDISKLSDRSVTSIVLWDVASRQQLGQPLTSHTGIVRSMYFSSDGRFLASAGDDKKIIIWNTNLESWLELACSIVGRNPTPNEWETYFGNKNYRNLCSKLTGPQR